MKPTIKELGEKKWSSVIHTRGIILGTKEYDKGIRIAINKQIIYLRTQELNFILEMLSKKQTTNIYQSYLFGLLKEKFNNEKQHGHIHRYINYLITEKPSYFEEHQKIIEERKILEEL